jgi:hypothetical protein
MVTFDINVHSSPTDYLAIVEQATAQEEAAIARLLSEGPPKSALQRRTLEDMLEHFEKQPEQYRQAANAWAPKDLRLYRAFKRYAVVGEATVCAIRELLSKEVEA